MFFSTIATIKEGYEIHTWYSKTTDVLVVGYKPDKITITAEPTE